MPKKPWPHDSPPPPSNPPMTLQSPEYSHLPEVSSAWTGVQAPEPLSRPPHHPHNNIHHNTGSPKEIYTTGVAALPPGAGEGGRQTGLPWLPPGYNAAVLAAQQQAAADGGAGGDIPDNGSEKGSRRSGSSNNNKRTIVILSVLVALLAAAVVGLATAAGLLAKRVNEAEAEVAAAAAATTGGNTATSEGVCVGASDGTGTGTTGDVATTTVTTTVRATATGTAQGSPVVDVSNGCSDRDERISGTNYKTQIFHQKTFTRYCNSQPKAFPIYGMLTLDFEACMDACAAWSDHPEILGPGNTNATCGGVRFVPAWTDRAVAYKSNARGNCFLQAAPQTTKDLMKPDLTDRVTCHAAILVK
ncbi:uncharacterized protein C8A04DRAFT_34008 [Dichotomopilus funicola]|uniref:Uncharacterized protein n=1 Tax=Dichotomopilus funicola TaxID=1934379 RepID=A0AAN6ZR66_9PEZI|nr:hypothetical protein C8A04DRAFT_34008 [Dichotomopilus funicola]